MCNTITIGYTPNIFIVEATMNFCPDRLIKIRTELGITKSEAARQLNMSAMGYGRYENGDRTPSYQTISFIAQKFGTF